jgi:hypothetical protein
MQEFEVSDDVEKKWARGKPTFIFKGITTYLRREGEKGI